MATLLVTGGAGFIGSHTVRQLAEAGEKIVVLDNMAYGHRDAIVHPGVELVIGDMGDSALVDTLFKAHEIEAVLHFAAWTMVGESMAEPLRYYQNNTAAPLVVLEAMRAHGAKRFIFSSTAATYGNPLTSPMAESHPQEPINPYGMSKLMLERVLADCDAAWGLKHVILRYFNAGGSSDDGLIGEDHEPETHLIPRVLMAVLGLVPELTVFGDDYPTPDGTCIRDYVHVSDLVDAHVLGLRWLLDGKGNRVFCLGSGEGFSVREVIEASRAVTNREVPIVEGARRPGDATMLVSGSSRAITELGWKPTRSNLTQMIGDALTWSRKPRFEK